MALANYTDLLAAVARWHHRDDGAIPDCVTLAEKRINTLLRDRLSELEASLTATIGSRYIALPAGYQFNVGLWMTTYGIRDEMIFVSSDRMPVDEDSSGQPRYYTIDGSNIAFEYKASSAFTYVLRYKKAYDLVSTATNYVMTNYPAVYLYGTLREVSNLSEDDNATMKYENMFMQAIDEAISTENKNNSQATLMTDGALISASRYNILQGDM